MRMYFAGEILPMRLYLRTLGYYKPDLSRIILLFLAILGATFLGLLQVWPLAVLMDSVLMPNGKNDWLHRVFLSPFPRSPIAQVVGLAALSLTFKLGQEALNFVRTLLNHHVNIKGL